MLKLLKAHPIAGPGFLLALALTLFFAGRLVLDMVYWADPAHRNQTPQAWMTPRYIAHSWGMDPKELGRALNMPKPSKERPTLTYIAEIRAVPVEQVLAEVEAILAQGAEERQRK